MARLPVSEGVHLVKQAREKEQEKHAWDMWLMQYQHMDKETFMPFSDFLDEYKRELNKQLEPHNENTLESVLKKVEEIKKTDQARGEEH